MTEEQFVKTTLTASHFLCKSCAIYGVSGGGKTTIIKHILYLIRSFITTVIVFSGSESINANYSRHIVPRMFVHDDVTEDMLSRIATRQKRAKQAYDIAHNPDVLYGIFRRCASPEQLAKAEKIKRMFEDFKRAHRGDLDEETETIYIEKRAAFLRAIIAPKRNELRMCQDLSDSERVALKWFYFNPRIAIIFDDCTSDIDHMKRCAETLELIFRGRHSMCTTVIALHDETALLPKARANISVSIFIDPITARGFADRKANGFQRAKREEVLRYADRVQKDTAPYTKMLFVGDKPSFITVETHGAFSAVSDAVRKWAEEATMRAATAIEPWMK